MEVLGFKVDILVFLKLVPCGCSTFAIPKVEEQLEILDSDDEPLKDNHDNDNIYVDSEDEAVVEALRASRTAAAIEIPDEDEEEEEDESMRTGWGECPMCTEVIFSYILKKKPIVFKYT